jgi:biotin carboxyl carrier protein
VYYNDRIAIPQREVNVDVHYQAGTEIITLHIEPQAGGYRVTIGARIYDVQIDQTRAPEIVLTINGQRLTAYVAGDQTARYVSLNGDVFELKKPEMRRTRRQRHQGEDNLTASMPGQITQVLVNAGDSVQRGQPLIVLEAMKMEIKIAAPHDGRVVRVLVEPGQVVDRGQGLIEMNNESMN